MSSEPIDFLDTNVVLGYTIQWDAYTTEVERYIDDRGNEQELVTSTRVFEEALSVVEKQRKRAREVADEIFEGFDPSHFDTVEDVKGFVRREYRSEWDKLGPILEYIEYHDGGYLGLTETDAEMALRRLYDEIEEDFRAPLVAVRRLRNESEPDVDLRHFDQGLGDYETVYRREFDSLDSFLDDKDRDILLDCYYMVMETRTEEVVFVTFDKNDIVDNSQQIEEHLTSIQIFDTSVYYT